MVNIKIIQSGGLFIGYEFGSSVIWSDKVCHLCLEFEVMSHGGTERTEDY